MAITLTYPTPLPSTKGWGPGWTPTGNCEAVRPHIVPHPIFQGGVHTDIKDLTDLLVAEIERRGMLFHAGWSWGFGCRATKGGSGSTPSFHSWGLALDMNAPANPFGGTRAQSAIATQFKWVPPLMARYGFFWLGPPIGDWMHFSFAGSPKDAATMTAKAKADFSRTVYIVDGVEFKRRLTALNAARKALSIQAPPGKVCIKKETRVG